MCGIFGSTNSKKFDTLYKLNRERGNFAFGCALVDRFQPELVHIQKYQGAPDKDLDFPHSCSVMLGHTQAPTSSVREWSEETSHPFECGDWIVAHNGILSNFEKLRRQYVAISHTNDVDSSIIPALLDLFQTKGIKGHESLIIAEVAELLEGTFACWIYNRVSGNTYLIRCSSTLFGDNYGNFSSVQFPNSFPLEEGVVYKFDRGLHSIRKFKYSSPFFAL